MKSINKRLISAAVAIIVLVVVAIFLKPETNFDKYHGLTLVREIEMDDTTRQILLDRIEQTRAQIQAYENGEMLDEEGNVKEFDLDLYLSLASDAYLLGDLVTAREALEAQLEANPLHYSAMNSYGEVLKLMGDYEGAKSAFYNAIVISQGAAEELFRDYVVILEEHFPGSDQEILATLEQGVKSRGQTPWFMVKLAEWYFEHDDCERSASHYKVAMTLAPTNESIKTDYLKMKEMCDAKKSN